MIGLESKSVTLTNTSETALGDFSTSYLLIQNTGATDIFLGSQANQHLKIGVGQTFNIGNIQSDSDRMQEHFDGSKIYIKGSVGGQVAVLYPRSVS